MEAVKIHLFRHGRVASHRGDIPITEAGHAEVKAAGLHLSESIRSGETIYFFSTATLRAKQTAHALYTTLKENLGQDARLHEPREEWAIRNPDLFLAGRRVEMVSTPEAMAQQIPDSGLQARDVDAVAFFQSFFRSSDRIGYWLNHPDPPGEDPAAVGRRIVAYGTSLLDVPDGQCRRFVCVTHSPVMRAVLVQYLDQDPGEPEWAERIDLVMEPGRRTITFRNLTTPLPA